MTDVNHKLPHTAKVVARQAPRDRTLSDQVYEQVLGIIMSGEVAVGMKLPTENTLSQQFQVSRPILRQALKQLREDGVIVSQRGSGSYVKRRPEGAVLNFAPVGSIADIQRTFEFRVAIEGEAAYIAAQRRSDANIKHLKSSLEELDRCVRENELGVVADEAFHTTVCAATNNQYFLDARGSMNVNILIGLNLTRSLSLTKPRERMLLVQKEHYAIYDAIAAKNPDAARDAMRTHIENARNRVFEGVVI